MKVYTYRQSLERQRGKKLQVEQDISDLKEKLVDIKRDLRRHEQAHIIIRTVGLETQQQLQFHISDITSLALEAVFPDPYELKVEFVERRNKTECDLRFVRDGEELNPMTSSGVGAVDVASFALRIASWSMERPRTRNVIILDEYLSFYQKIIRIRLHLCLKIEFRLGLQFIIVTHEPILASYADRTFEVRKKGKSIKTIITMKLVK